VEPTAAATTVEAAAAHATAAVEATCTTTHRV
jgi:hypothetical protein